MPYKLVTPAPVAEDEAVPTKKRYRLVEPTAPPETEVGPKADRLDAKPLTWKETLDDYANAAGSNIARAFTADLAGAPGDIRELGNAASNYLFPNSQANFEKYGGTSLFNALPTSEELTPEGLKYDPKTTAGKYIGTTARLASNIATPGGALRKMAMVVAPGVLSEAAGQATEGTAAEPWARIGGAMVGGVGAAGRGTTVPKVLAKTAAETPESVRQQTKVMFDQLRSAGIGYDRDAFQNMANKILTDLNNRGVRAAQAPLSADAVNAIQEKLGNDIDFNDVESLLETVGGIFGENASNKDKFAAGIIKEHLDDYAHNGITHTAGNLAPEEVGPLITQAREMARRNILAKHIAGMESQAVKKYQSGEQSGLRNQFANYLGSKKGDRLTPEETEAFSNVVHGYKNLERAGRFGLDFSKLGSPSMFFPTILQGATYAGGEPLTGAAGIAAATAAKYASRAGTKKNVRDALATVLAGPEAQRGARSIADDQRRDALVRRLLSGGTATYPVREE